VHAVNEGEISRPNPSGTVSNVKEPGRKRPGEIRGWQQKTARTGRVNRICR